MSVYSNTVIVTFTSLADLMEIASWIRSQCGDLSEGKWDMKVGQETLVAWFASKSDAMLFKLTWS